MSLWAPKTSLPSTIIDTISNNNHRTRSKNKRKRNGPTERSMKRACTSEGTTMNSYHQYRHDNPHREAARMKVLKKLRHKLVVLTKPLLSSAQKDKLPVLCFERWLARYALRCEERKNEEKCHRQHLRHEGEDVEDAADECDGEEDQHRQKQGHDYKSSAISNSYSNSYKDDPIIPSDGHIDSGLVKDLSRSIPSSSSLSSPSSESFLPCGETSHTNKSCTTAEDIARTLAMEAQALARDLQDDPVLGLLGGNGGGTGNCHEGEQLQAQRRQLLSAGRKTAEKNIRHGARSVRTKAKLVQKILDQASCQEEGTTKTISDMTTTDILNNDGNDRKTFDGNGSKIVDINISLSDALKELKSATAELEQKVQMAQKNAVCPLAVMRANVTSGKFSNTTAATITGSTATTTSSGELLCGGISMNGARRDGIYDITLKGPSGKPNRPYLTISKQHLTKLIHLWVLQQEKERHSGDNLVDGKNTREHDIQGVDSKLIRSLEQNNKGNNFDPVQYIECMPENDQPRLRKAIYSCLARYEALRGSGYQCAVPGAAFNAAVEAGLGPTIECFASPLNCRYRQYCSAFPDVEHQFGSLGSFFDDMAFDPSQGSFEANPPFVPETMYAMAKKIQRLLDDGQRGPLSFLVIIPNWGAGSGFCEKLEQSKHARVNLLIPAVDHAFYDGAQHTKLIDKRGSVGKPLIGSSLLRPSSWDTAVILLQNDKGSSKWPVKEKRLKETFCNALRRTTSNMADNFNTLEKWERRGVSNGGSVKKRKQQRASKNQHIVF